MSNKKELISELTPEQESQIQVYVDKYLTLANSGAYREVYKHESVSKLVDWMYTFSGFAKPMTILARNPYEAQMINQYLTKNYNTKIDQYLDSTDEAERSRLYDEVIEDVYKNISPVSDGNYTENYIFTADVFTNVLLGWWGYMIDVLKLESDINAEFLLWRELYENAGVYNAICNDKVCITSKYPEKISRNEAGDLHSTTDPAVVWEGMEWKCYYINGRNIPAKEFEMALDGEVTKEIYDAETNEDIRAAWYEILGQEKMLDVLDAMVVDTGTFVHNNGDIEEVILYKTRKSYPETGDNPYAWIRFTCPSTGTVYLIDVDPKYNTALEAAVSTTDLVSSVEDYKFDDRA